MAKVIGLRLYLPLSKTPKFDNVAYIDVQVVIPVRWFRGTSSERPL